MAHGAPLLRLENIEAHYGPVRAVSNITLEVPAGEVVAILGANGAGKSTILRTIMGLHNPTRGRVVFDGRAIQGQAPDAIARSGISLVPEGRQLFPLLSVRENLLMGAYARQRGDEIVADEEEAYALFPRLKERAGQPAGRLSGGEQQMVAIARALMARPRLLLLDEPSLGLSPRLIKEIYAVIGGLCARRSMTMLVVEQNAQAALEVSGHGYVVEVGRIVFSGRVEELRAHRDIREFYLGIREAGQRSERRWKREKTWR